MGRSVGTGATPVGPARFFVALRPDRAARQALGQCAATLAHRHGGRALCADDTHLTLAFIGAREASFEACLARLLAPAGTLLEPQALVLGRLRHFGRGRGRMLVWTGPESTPSWLAEAAATVREALNVHAVAFDDRPFVPHLTLVRSARAATALAPALPAPVRVASWRLAIGCSRPAGVQPRYAWSDIAPRRRIESGPTP